MPTSANRYMTLKEQVGGVVDAALSLLFPSRCVSCGDTGSLLCSACVGHFRLLSGETCSVCCTPVKEAGLCIDCSRHARAFSQVVSPFIYDGVLRSAIHAMKYRGMRSLAGIIADAAAEHLDASLFYDRAICPVPMYASRLAERGYNHAELLAGHLAAVFNAQRLQPDALVRTRQTARQVDLSYNERLENLVDAFRADPASVSNRRILLVDDICTTGATLHNCAQELLASGAVSVAAVTMARTV